METLNNREDAINFLKKYPKEQYLEKKADGGFTGSINKNTDLGKEYEAAFYQYWRKLGSNDSDAAANAFLLARFDAGISLSKKTKNQSKLATINSTSDTYNNYSTSQCN